MTTTRAALFLATLALAAAATPAEAKSRIDSFAGGCELTGTSRFSPPATNARQALTVSYRATGVCTGTLNGKAVTDVPVSVRNLARNVDGSCPVADTTQPGTGVLMFAGGAVIRIRFEFHFVGTDGTFTFSGRRSGAGHGTGSFLTPRTSPEVVADCAGSGAEAAPLDVSLETDSPLVSRRPKKAPWRPLVFNGSCTFAGTVRFSPPLDTTPSPVDQEASAPGHCSGTLVDRRGILRPLQDAPVSFAETSHGEQATCGGGTAAGRGWLQFRWGRLRFDFAERRIGPMVTATTPGAWSGSASGSGGVSDSEDPAKVLEQCAGPGLSSVAIDVEMQTDGDLAG